MLFCNHVGKIYIVGGFDGNNCTNTVEMYDPAQDRWSMLPPMSISRSGVSCISHRGFIYALGNLTNLSSVQFTTRNTTPNIFSSGGYSGIDRLRTVERLDVKANHWSPVASMKSPRSNFTVAIIEDMILVIGGYSHGTTVDTVEAFDVKTERW